MATTMTQERGMTATERRRRADDARRAANKVAGEAEEKLAALERSARGPDLIAKLRAEAALPNLRVEAATLRAGALEAQDAYRSTEDPWRREAFEAHRPRLIAKATQLVAALQAVHDREYAEMLEAIEAARATGVLASTLPLAEFTFALMFGRTGGSSVFENCVSYLRRHGWL